MNPRKAKVDKLLKFKGTNASHLAFCIVAAAIGAFVIGTVVVRAADDVLAPPTALFPDQGSLPDIGGGGGAGNLLDLLKGGSLAKWGNPDNFHADTIIGGRLGLGQIRETAAATLRMAYPLDIQIVHNSDEEPTPSPANAYLNKNDTAVLRIASLGNNPAGKLWTGIQLARINPALDNTQADPAFTEKWFIGMNESNDHFIIRANGSNTDTSKRVNIVDIDPDKGAACIGAMYVGVTTEAYNGKAGDAKGGYTKANEKCKINLDGAHMCSVEEIMRTITCKSGPFNGGGWVNQGPPGYILTLSNDCEGWQNNTPNVLGAYWSWSGKKFGTATCDTLKKFLCCK